MSNNLLKGSFTRLNTDNVRVIDSNSLLLSKIKAEPEKKQKGMMLTAEPDADGFARGIATDVVNVEPSEEIEEAGLKAMEITPEEEAYGGTSPDELIEEANAQIAQMKAEAEAAARQEAEQIKEAARQQGYREGCEKAERELQEKEKALSDRQSRMEQEFEEKVSALEPQLADTLAGIYEYIFQVDLSPYQDIVTYLVISALKKSGESKSCIVHVSKEDYPHVSSRKEEMTKGLPSGLKVDIIEDITLGKNEALIETDGGIIDCGLGTQLTELGRKIRLLAYEKTEG